MLRVCVILVYLVVGSRAEMEAYIVGGGPTDVSKYPHSVYLWVESVEKVKTNWACGTSLVNQQILLTAAHCVSGGKEMKIVLNFEETGRQGGKQKASTLVIHQNYKERSSDFDIALIRMNRAIKLTSWLSRVAIMPKPPYYETAHVAGWGYINEKTSQISSALKHVDQRVWKHDDCLKKLGSMPVGTICASSKNKDYYPSGGDSGSALVVRGYIQIGLVSYKMPNVGRNIIVYTDVGYFYNWIKLNARHLNCFTRNKG